MCIPGSQDLHIIEIQTINDHTFSVFGAPTAGLPEKSISGDDSGFEITQFGLSHEGNLC